MPNVAERHYVNCGALVVVGEKAQRIKTKAKLKELIDLRDRRGINIELGFDQTAIVHSGHVPGTATLEDLKEGVILSVCGPDPYTDRRWYAQVLRNKDGKVVVR